MRKLWCAGAIACGFLLLGAAPAQAEPLSNPGGAGAPLDALGDALEPTNGWRVAGPVASDPLSGQPLVTLQPAGDRKLLQWEPGADSDVTGALSAQRPAHRAEKPADRRRPLAPAADVISGTRPDSAEPAGALGGMPVSGVPMPLAGQDFTVADAPVDGLVSTLPMVSGLTPAGMSALPGTPTADRRPVARRAERQSADFPLLGGLDGTATTMDELQRRFVDVRSGFSGLPIGGSPVRRSATGAPATSTPATGTPGTGTPGRSATGRAAEPATSAPAVTTPATRAPATGESPATDAVPADPAAPLDPVAPSASATPGPAQRASTGLPATEAEDPRLYEEPVDGFVAK